MVYKAEDYTPANHHKLVLEPGFHAVFKLPIQKLLRKISDDLYQYFINPLQCKKTTPHMALYKDNIVWNDQH